MPGCHFERSEAESRNLLYAPRVACSVEVSREDLSTAFASLISLEMTVGGSASLEIDDEQLISRSRFLSNIRPHQKSPPKGEGFDWD